MAEDESTRWTKAAIQRISGSVIVGKKRPSREFVRGVLALENALCGIGFAAKGGRQTDHPTIGMRVRCRTRACTLTVLRWSSGEEQAERGDPDRVSPNRAACDSAELSLRVKIEGRKAREDDPDERWMRLSTWRRWTKGGTVLDDSPYLF